MKHFTLSELTRSDTARAKGLDNTPAPEHRANLEMLVAMLLDPLREAWDAHCMTRALGTPAICVSSGYRGFRLNAAVGGSSTSAHCAGLAADLVPVNGHLHEFKEFCRGFLAGTTGDGRAASFAGRAFDQMISEDEDAAGTPRWIHIGCKNREGAQRRQLLTMRGGKYAPMTK